MCGTERAQCFSRDWRSEETLIFIDILALEVVISSGIALLEGTVTDNDQNQPLGVQVRARSDPPSEHNRFRWHQASTDQSGHYVIKDVPPGKYKVTARIPSPGEGAPAIKSDPVAVTLGERERRTVVHQADCSEKRVNGAGDRKQSRTDQAG